MIELFFLVTVKAASSTTMSRKDKVYANISIISDSQMTTVFSL